jgi:hypothetical protein
LYQKVDLLKVKLFSTTVETSIETQSKNRVDLGKHGIQTVNLVKNPVNFQAVMAVRRWAVRRCDRNRVLAISPSPPLPLLPGSLLALSQSTFYCFLRL